MNQLPRLEDLSSLLSIETLSGTKGSNRVTDKQPLINATNDLEAVETWLNEYVHKNTTYRSYRKEAERLLLWCVIQAKKALSSLNRDDLEIYFDFLDDPQPRHVWCKKKGGYGIKRGEAGWKPFEGGLSQSAKNTVISILKSLFSYLHEARYLDSNPLTLMRNIRQRKTTMDEQKLKVYERILADDEWAALIETLQSWPDKTPEEQAEKLRLKLLVGLLFFLGLRVDDVTTSTWKAFRKINDHWWFFIRGKGDKLAKIPVNSELLKIIIDYRVHFDMTVYPYADDNQPLIFSFKSRTQPIGNRQVNYLVKKLAQKTAKKFPDQLAKQKKLIKLSPHWFRHQSASMQARVGVPAEHIRENMRHTSYLTTMIYVHTDDRGRFRTINHLSIKEVS